MAQISAGIRAVGQTGDDVGTVNLIRLGDPQAVTTDGQGRGGGLTDTIDGLVGEAEPDLPEQFAAQLLRTGFVKIDCSGAFAGDVYAPAEEIAAVRDYTDT